MKRSILAMLVGFFALSINAQSTSQKNQEQLNLAIVKAKNLRTTGAIITISGCVLDVTGIVLLATSPVNGTRTGFLGGTWDTYDWRGGGVLYTGLALSCGGLWTWIIGAVKKNNYEIKLAKYKVSASLNSIGLQIRF